MNKPLLEIFRKAYRDLDLFPLFSAEEIKRFRVEYGGDTLARLEQVIDDAPTDGKIVFAGHRGCGKSTLLAKLARQMQDLNYFVVLFSIADMVEMSAVDHVNILYAIAVQLLSKATRMQVAIPEKTKETILKWLITTRTESVTQDLKSQFGVGGDILKLITAKLQSESTFREEIKHTYERRINDLVQKIDEIARSIQEVTKREVLVIIDDLDKLDWQLVEEIYQNNINALFRPQIRIVFTIPIAVIRDIELRTILQTASGTPIQQMEVAKFFTKASRHDPAATPAETKMQVFLQVLAKRIPTELIEPETAREMVLQSGGVIRELVRIARGCCSQCLLQLRSDPTQTDVKINQEVLQLALRDIRNDFAASLGESRYEILATTYHQAEPTEITDQEFLVLLHGLYILEYRNDDLWYDVHPVVVELLRRRNLLTAITA
ncbi:P-loop NTPase fold protein [Pantanalinema rosaneae CENA516]|uniref:P-loop NTPase fold protein n=1 Tax=Pantanalinema rosaneae TaxID=1620701 RepID=UPI003D6EF84E